MTSSKSSKTSDHIIDEPIEFTIKSKDIVGERIDKHLAKQFPSHSRRFLQQLIDDGAIKVNGKKTVSRYKLKEDDKLTLYFPDRPVKLKLEAEDLNLDVVYEDDNIMLINKPAGMVVHPADRHRHLTGTVVNAILHHCKENVSKGSSPLRPGIIHRLDKNTSGLLIVGKSSTGHKHMARVMKERRIEKTYLTLVKGHLKPRSGSIDAPIGRDVKNRYKHAVGGLNPRHALTHYNVIAYLANGEIVNEGMNQSELNPKQSLSLATLLEVKIVTGRTHQIRVHLSSIGYPVIGDDMYGDDKVNAYFEETYELDRQFLHAWKLKFRIPEDEDDTEFIGSVPRDLMKVVDSHGVEL